MFKHPPSLSAIAVECPVVFFFDANCLIVFIYMACYYSTRYLPGYTVQAGDIIVYNTWGILYPCRPLRQTVRLPETAEERERTLQRGQRVYEERTNNGFFY